MSSKDRERFLLRLPSYPAAKQLPTPNLTVHDFDRGANTSRFASTKLQNVKLKNTPWDWKKDPGFIAFLKKRIGIPDLNAWDVAQAATPAASKDDLDCRFPRTEADADFAVSEHITSPASRFIRSWLRKDDPRRHIRTPGTWLIPEIELLRETYVSGRNAGVDSGVRTDQLIAATVHLDEGRKDVDGRAVQSLPVTRSGTRIQASNFIIPSKNEYCALGETWTFDEPDNKTSTSNNFDKAKALVIIELKKYDYIRPDGILDLAANQIAIGDKKSKKSTRNATNMRIMLQQVVRYTCHYQTPYVTVLDYKSMLVLRVPLEMDGIDPTQCTVGEIIEWAIVDAPDSKLILAYLAHCALIAL